jgi:hypothetical protein
LIEDIERKIESDDLDELKEAVLLTKQLKKELKEIKLNRYSWKYPPNATKKEV